MKSSDGYWLLPSASDISFFARYADALDIGSCVPLPSAFVDGTYTYVCREHVGSSQDSRLRLQLAVSG